MVRIIFWVLGALWAVDAILIEAGAKSLPQQILGHIEFVIAAIFITGAEIVAAIVRIKEKAPDIDPESAKSI